MTIIRKAVRRFLPELKTEERDEAIEKRAKELDEKIARAERSRDDLGAAVDEAMSMIHEEEAVENGVGGEE